MPEFLNEELFWSLHRQVVALGAGDVAVEGLVQAADAEGDDGRQHVVFRATTQPPTVTEVILSRTPNDPHTARVVGMALVSSDLDLEGHVFLTYGTSRTPIDPRADAEATYAAATEGTIMRMAPERIANTLYGQMGQDADAFVPLES